MKKEHGMYLAYLFQTFIGLNCIYAFVAGNLVGFFSALIMFIVTLIPFFVAYKMKISFPWFVYFLIALSLWFHTAGYIQGYYEMYYPYYDKIAHLVSGTTVALLGFIGVLFLDRHWNMTLTVPFIVGFIIIFGVALGAFWEMYEFLVDTFLGGSLGGPMQNSLADTMLDMIFVLAGSILVAIMGVIYFHKHHQCCNGESMTGDEETN